MKRLLLFSTLAAVCALAAQSAKADPVGSLTFRDLGQEMVVTPDTFTSLTSSVTFGGTFGSPETGTGYFAFSAPLSANFIFDTVTLPVGSTFGSTEIFTSITGLDIGKISFDATEISYQMPGDLLLTGTFSDSNYTGVAATFLITPIPNLNGAFTGVLATGSPTPGATPEPSSLALLGTGALAVAGAVRRRLR